MKTKSIHCEHVAFLLLVYWVSWMCFHFCIFLLPLWLGPGPAWARLSAYLGVFFVRCSGFLLKICNTVYTAGVTPSWPFPNDWFACWWQMSKTLPGLSGYGIAFLRNDLESVHQTLGRKLSLKTAHTGIRVSLQEVWYSTVMGTLAASLARKLVRVVNNWPLSWLIVVIADCCVMFSVACTQSSLCFLSGKKYFMKVKRNFKTN